MQAQAWTSNLPTQAGFHEVWDPRRNINRIVQIYRTPGGSLAVRNFCPCKYAFLIQMWELPCFAGTHWRGPIHVPDGLNTKERDCLLQGCAEAASGVHEASRANSPIADDIDGAQRCQGP